MGKNKEAQPINSVYGTVQGLVGLTSFANKAQINEALKSMLKPFAKISIDRNGNFMATRAGNDENSPVVAMHLEIDTVSLSIKAINKEGSIAVNPGSKSWFGPFVDLQDFRLVDRNGKEKSRVVMSERFASVKPSSTINIEELSKIYNAQIEKIELDKIAFRELDKKNLLDEKVSAKTDDVISIAPRYSLISIDGFQSILRVNADFSNEAFALNHLKQMSLVSIIETFKILAKTQATSTLEFSLYYVDKNSDEKPDIKGDIIIDFNTHIKQVSGFKEIFEPLIIKPKPGASHKTSALLNTMKNSIVSDRIQVGEVNIETESEDFDSTSNKMLIKVIFPAHLQSVESNYGEMINIGKYYDAAILIANLVKKFNENELALIVSEDQNL